MGDFPSRVEPQPVTVVESERFQELVAAAEALLDELAGRYVVERRETKEPLGEGDEVVRTVRLMPHSPAAGPLAICFPDTSARIVLRLGRWFEQSLPGYQDDIDELRKLAVAHVEGGLWERIRRGLSGSWLETRLIGPEITVSREAPVDAVEARAARREGFAMPVQWSPWTRRA
ncbi:DUF6226 family protein [Winogradskya consettensis]|uniref:Uncharacterized protein n=1 Tax=Winogradskya consettensis TaxID=113560 RepID=A0A919SZW7_9ACTN|nr:DUF6226 family protein [Actinoplanes consettensis]GIM82598.1 hypothetical protein Aco04nite_82310 [Actinoplanes consettensis]